MHRLPTDIETTIKVDKSKDFRVMGTPGVVRMRYQPRTASFEFVR